MILGRAHPWTPSVFTGTISFVGGDANNSSDTITLPGSPAAGDIAVILNLAANNNSVSPTSVVPTGFTLFGTSQTYSAATRRARFNKSYKVLAGGESSITCMSAADQATAAFVFRKTSGTWAAPAGIQEGLDYAGLTTSQVVTVGAGPLVVFSAALISGIDLVLTPSATGSFDDADENIGAYKLFNTSPANTTASVTDPYKAMCSGYIALTP